MTGTPDLALLSRSQSLDDSAPEPPSSINIQDDFNRLCTGSGTAEVSALRRTMRRVASDEQLKHLASFSAPPSSQHAFVLNPHPPIDRVGRFEALNDVAGRKPRVFRKSPCPPRARNFSPASGDDDKDFHQASYSVNDSHPRFERVGRFESLNDVAGRQPRVFRKSPCPPLARISSPASGDDDSDGASDTEC